MPRRRAEPRFRAAGTVLRFGVKAVPRASSSEIVGWHGDRLRVRLKAAPERGSANRELVALLARALGVPRGAVRVIAGTGATLKTVAVEGLTCAEAERRLAAGSL